MQTAVQDVLDVPTLTAYISYAQKHIHPQLTDEAAELLTRGYVEMRRRGNFAGSSKKVVGLKMHPSRCVCLLVCENGKGPYDNTSIFFKFPQVITATPRQIESLIRLSEALARIRFSERVGLQKNSLHNS